MKKILPLFLLFTIGVSTSIFAQEPGWIENVTHKLGLDSARASYVYVTDINNDNFPDLIFVKAELNYGKVSVFMNVDDPVSSNPKDRIFIDTTAWTHLGDKRDDQPGRTIDNIAFADIDNDGDVDAVTGIYYHRWEYYHPGDPGDRCEVMFNNGQGQFSIMKNSGLNSIGPHTGSDDGLVNISGITFLDYNKDGNLDLFLSSWFDDYKLNQDAGGSNGMTSSYLLRGLGDGSFSDESFYTRISQNKFPLYGANATDWNNDGWMDIATAPYCRSGGSLWVNQKDGRYLDQATLTGYNTQYKAGASGQALCTWASQPMDYDNDGDIDFYYVLVHGGFGTNEGRSTLVLNEGADSNYKLKWALEKVFRDPPRPSHIGDYDASWFDIDNDMLPDLVSGSGSYTTNRRLFILKQDNNGDLRDISGKLDIISINTIIREIYSIEALDYDLDGDDDILIAHGDGTTDPKYSVEIIENKIGNQNNWVGIRLFSPETCNQSGVGCRIIVYSGGVAQMREIQAGYGHFGGQQPFLTNFGLGSNTKVDSVVIQWQTNPATSTTVYNIQINKFSIINKNGFWGTLGEKEFANKPEFEYSIYPNPASERLIVKANIPASNLNYEILDISGKMIKNGIISTGGFFLPVIELDGIQNGYYFLRLIKENSESKAIPFVILNN